MEEIIELDMQKKYEFTSRIYIFGAQSRAKTLRGYLRYLYPQIVILSFLVDDIEGNETSIDGVPVRILDSVEKIDSSCDIFIATKGIYHEDITNRLKKRGMERIIPITVALDNAFRNAYVKKYYWQEHENFIKITDLCVHQSDAVIYSAKSVYDKTLQSKYNCPVYEKEIQVGAALTSRRLSPNVLTDCDGENISTKNRQYCELTALYWIWKNTKEDVVGLSHYRRHFILPDNWQDIMYTNDIDVILPVPTFVYPNIRENYKERHDPSDWEYMMYYLEQNYPNDFNEAEEVFSKNLYFPCNMFIVRRKILDDLCSWMFPIIDAVVKHGGVKEDTYLNRYPGFISERLITLYFFRKSINYHIVYADKNFIV